MPSNSKKATSVLLIVITVVLLGVTGLIVVKLQQSQAPVDSSASGFGDTATSDLYNTTSAAFKNTPCDFFFLGEELLTVTLDSTFATTTDIRSDYIPLRCIYSLDENRAIILELFAYTLSSPIDADAETLHERINLLNTLDVFDSGRQSSILYFYGVSHTGNCVSTMFDDQNDFEYARLTYVGFDCTETIGINSNIIINNIAYKLMRTMVGVNLKYTGSGT